jgi:hypothetical protein
MIQNIHETVYSFNVILLYCTRQAGFTNKMGISNIRKVKPVGIFQLLIL